MSHVNAEKAVVSQIKSIAEAGMAKMMDSPMEKMDMGSMMGGMGPMMKGGMGLMMDEGMSSMMKDCMGSMMTAPGVAGVVVYSGSNAGNRIIRKIFTHPLVLFSLGAVVGGFVYKYRKSIIRTSVEPRQEE